MAVLREWLWIAEDPLARSHLHGGSPQVHRIDASFRRDTLQLGERDTNRVRGRRLVVLEVRRPLENPTEVLLVVHARQVPGLGCCAHGERAWVDGIRVGPHTLPHYVGPPRMLVLTVTQNEEAS